MYAGDCGACEVSPSIGSSLATDSMVDRSMQAISSVSPNLATCHAASLTQPPALTSPVEDKPPLNQPTPPDQITPPHLHTAPPNLPTSLDHQSALPRHQPVSPHHQLTPMDESPLVMSQYRDFAAIQYHDITTIHGTIHHDTSRYRPSMKQQIIRYRRQCVWCVQELRRKISSQRVLMLKHVRLTLDNCLSSAYPSCNIFTQYKPEQDSCKKD